MSVNVCITNFNSFLARYGTEQQKEKYIPPVLQGDALAAFGLTEPEAGSDALSLKTNYKKKGDRYILNGSKTFITNAPLAKYFLIVARQAGSSGTKEGTYFILERGMKGLSTGKPFRKMGMRCSPTGEIFMDNVEVSADCILGGEGNGFKIMFETLDEERVLSGITGVGISQACIEVAVKYSKERMQFQRPISSFQMIQDMLAKMATNLCIARQYIYSLCPLVKIGVNLSKEASIAKYFATNMASKIGLDAIQILGGYGYMREYAVERYMRDAKLITIGGGTSEIQKLIIVRELLKE
jgi:alkylation response protein AidB-like acyl-CoA dehydrogenase